jgi:magnesium transporter
MSDEHKSETETETQDETGPEGETDVGDLFEQGSNEKIDAAFVTLLGGMIGDRDKHGLRRALAEEHPADAADALEQLSSQMFEAAVVLLGQDFDPEILIELAPDLRERAVDLLPDSVILAALEHLDSDDAGVILDDLEDDRRIRLLGQIDAVERVGFETSLAFDEETAGRLMQREFVAAPSFWTVGKAIDHMRKDGVDLPDVFFELYVVDPAFILQGVVPVSTLLKSQRDVPLIDLMEAPLAPVRPEMDQEEVAFLFQKYHLASAPVVDEAGRLTGMITVDDIVSVMDEENAEDLLALHGVNQAAASDTVFSSVAARAPWLGVNLLTALIASSVIALFEGTIEAVVALAVLMPLVSAVGGNAGAQALAVSVRAMASRELSGAAVGRAVRREALTGLMNGLIFATAAAAVALVWFSDLLLASIIGFAMLATFAFAGLAGILVPLGLRRMGADPAVASSVFVLTSIDIVGFFTFLGLATLLLL